VKFIDKGGNCNTDPSISSTADVLSISLTLLMAKSIELRI
jgi:hypothetical protein